VIDLQPLFFYLTLDITIALLLDKSVYSLRLSDGDKAGNKAFTKSFIIALEGLAKRFRITPFYFLYSPLKFRRVYSVAYWFIKDYIHERGLQKSTNAGELYGFIDQLAQKYTTPTKLRDQLLNILLAGRDTIAYCLS
jgi:hypothetical protein